MKKIPRYTLEDFNNKKITAIQLSIFCPYNKKEERTFYISDNVFDLRQKVNLKQAQVLNKIIIENDCNRSFECINLPITVLQNIDKILNG